MQKDNTQAKQRKTLKREGSGGSPLRSELCQPLGVSPGMTGTGAPVTEQLRYLFSGELGWYRDSRRPYV